MLENVVFDPASRVLDFDDASKTENTRACYPLDYIPNTSASGQAGHPDTIVMLTADAFGVLPPISKLTAEQAMYHFLGYTARVAGTEKGLGSEPQATFSTCFGAPFMPRHPSVYGEMLRERIAKHGSTCWLVNTGWSGGRAGAGGERMSIAHTRAMVRAALDGGLSGVGLRQDPNFGLLVPEGIPNVPANVLDPRSVWSDKGGYDNTALELRGRSSSRTSGSSTALSATRSRRLVSARRPKRALSRVKSECGGPVPPLGDWQIAGSTHVFRPGP